MEKNGGHQLHLARCWTIASRDPCDILNNPSSRRRLLLLVFVCLCVLRHDKNRVYHARRAAKPSRRKHYGNRTARGHKQVQFNSRPADKTVGD